MRTVTVELPDDVAERAEQAAAVRGVTVADLAREAIEAQFPQTAPHRFGFTGIAASGDGTLSESYKQIRRDEIDT